VCHGRECKGDWRSRLVGAHIGILNKATPHQGPAINGHVKPLFQDMKVYDKRQDAEKSFFRKAYEALVGGVARLLQNKQREEVTTVADVTGHVGSPKTSTWQVIGRLIENAFIRAILPGFDREVARQRALFGRILSPIPRLW